MAENTKQKTAAGMVWTSIQKFAGMGVSFIAGIILARLLTPEDYGCIGMLSIFMIVAATFVDSGFGSALIQKKQPTLEDYSTVFYFNLGMAVLMYVILFTSSPAIARFYKMPLLSSVLRVQGVVLLINALSAIQDNQLRKQFKFKKIAIIQLFASIVASSVAIYMAYSGFGVWSLVVSNLLSPLIIMISFWSTNKWYPLLVFSKQSFKELFGFGFFMFLTGIINNVCNNVQGLLIGRLYNPGTMGYYSKARSTEELASTSVASVVGQVSYPLFAEYQNDKKLLINTIKRLTETIAYITCPLMFLLILLAKPVFILLYSDRWLESVPYFQLLCLAGIAASLQCINYNAIVAIGKSKLTFQWTIIKRVIGLCLMVGGLAVFGMKGLLGGMVLQSWIIYFINVILVDKHIGYKFKNQMKDLIPVFILSVISILIPYGLVFIGPNINMYFLAVIQFVVFVLLYWGISIIFKMESYKYFIDNLPFILGRLKKKS